MSTERIAAKVYFTAEEMERVRGAAEDAGASVSAYILHVVLAELDGERREGGRAKLRKEAEKVGEQLKEFKAEPTVLPVRRVEPIVEPVPVEPQSSFDYLPTVNAQNAKSTGREQEVRGVACEHGVKRDYHCWQCGGIAKVAGEAKKEEGKRGRQWKPSKSKRAPG